MYLKQLVVCPSDTFNWDAALKKTNRDLMQLCYIKENSTHKCDN